VWSDALARLEDVIIWDWRVVKGRAMAEVLYRFMAKDSVATADGIQGSPQWKSIDWLAIGGFIFA